MHRACPFCMQKPRFRNSGNGALQLSQRFCHQYLGRLDVLPASKSAFLSSITVW